MSRRRRETALQEALHGPQSSPVVPECPAMTSSTNYPEASTLRGEAQGCYRFQAQYLRRIRVPAPDTVPASQKRALAEAFTDRDVERATGITTSLYGIDLPHG